MFPCHIHISIHCYARRLALGGLLVGLTSCNAQDSQCRQFAAITQESQSIRADFDSEIESAQLQASGAQDLAQIKAAAQDYTGAVSKVTGQLDTMRQSFEALTLEDEQLDEYRDRYVVFLSESKATLENAGAAMQMVVDAETEADFRDSFGSLTTQGDRAASELQALDAEEDTILDQFNAYCTEET